MRSSTPSGGGKKRGRSSSSGSNGAKRLGEHHGGSFGVYMAHKIQKLRNQNSALVSSSATQLSPSLAAPAHASRTTNSTRNNSRLTPATQSPASIFHGVHIYVDGYTTPGKEELRQLLLQHGGGFEHYETARVTHIIATHLPASKVLQLKKMRKPTPVVHPDWIVQSIAQRQLLDTRPFLYHALTDPTQRSLFRSNSNNILHLAATSSNSILSLSSALSLSTAADGNTRPLSPSSLPIAIDPQVFDTPSSSAVAAVAVAFAATDSTASTNSHNTSNTSNPPVVSLLEGSETEEIDSDDDDSGDVDAFPSENDPLSNAIATTTTTDNNTNNSNINSNSNSSFTVGLPTILLPPSASISTSTPQQPQLQATSNNNKRIQSTRDGAAAFVRHFFAKSRLHHIGSWRATFEQHAQAFAALYKGPLPMKRAPPTSTQRVLLHVDMDCFFVAVAIRTRSDLEAAHVPVAVAHSTGGTSEISSCNYVARASGVKAGMLMRTAQAFCPALVVLPYDFDAIERVTFAIYSIFFAHTPLVQAMSCDEALLEFDAQTNGEATAERIRQQIYDATQCRASVGVSYNILLAKLASQQAKPNGVLAIVAADDHATEQFLDALRVRDLPGIGRQLSVKLEAINVTNVAQLRAIPRVELARHVGAAVSERLAAFARGIDHRPLVVDSDSNNEGRKSVSAVVNFGIRFTNAADATAFLYALADELVMRLQALRLYTSCITLQLKKRCVDAPLEPAKFMGHGACDNFAKRHVLATPTDDATVIARVAMELLRSFHFAPSDLRGVGLQATKLVVATASTAAAGGGNTGSGRTTSGALTTWLQEPVRPTTSSLAIEQQEEPVQIVPDTNEQRGRDATTDNAVDTVEPHSASLVQSHQRNSDVYANNNDDSTFALSQVNLSVFQELPSWLQTEVLAMYKQPRQRRDGIGSNRTTAALTTRSTVVLAPPPPTRRQTNGKRPRGRPRKYVLVASTPGNPATKVSTTTTYRSTVTTAATSRILVHSPLRNNSNNNNNTIQSDALNALDNIRMSQIDSDVYYALPFPLRREIDRNAKRSHATASVAQAAAARRRQALPLSSQDIAAAAHAQVAHKSLQTIEELCASVLATATRANHNTVDHGAALLSQLSPSLSSSVQSEAFDAVYSRILIEVEHRALDHAVRMLRFVRRQCAQASSLATSSNASASDDASSQTLAFVLQSGFNRVLAQVNRDVQQHFDNSVLALAAVAPL